MRSRIPGPVAQWSAERSYNALVLADRPLSYWPLMETSGSTALDVAGGRNLTYYNSPTLDVAGPTSGPIRGVTFNGSTQIAYGPDVAAFNLASSGSWSLECWAKASYSMSNTNSRIVTVINYAATTTAPVYMATIRYLGGSGGALPEVAAYTSANAVMTVGPVMFINDNRWHHFVAVAVSGGALGLYVDGVYVAESTTARSTTSVNRTVAVGATPNNGTTGNQFSGSVAAVALYDYSLTAAQVLAHYGAGVARIRTP